MEDHKSIPWRMVEEEALEKEKRGGGGGHGKRTRNAAEYQPISEWNHQLLTCDGMLCAFTFSIVLSCHLAKKVG